MVRYMSAAVALKCFSATSLTRGWYRQIANTVGNSQRSTGQIPDYYIERIRRMLRLARQHRIIRDGDHVLELGTGWLHWEALTIRLFWDVRATLFDVWDNRQFDGLQNYCRQLRSSLRIDLDLTPAETGRAEGLLDAILNTSSFEELYGLLGFEYLVERSGSLARLPDGCVQLVVSGGVLEHVRREVVADVIAQTHRVLAPGGVAVHSIDTSDHLSHYDRTVSKKRYLAFSENTWQWLFENQLQYINRLQRSEWVAIFESTGFDVMDEECRRVDISELRVGPRYSHIGPADLACTVVKYALRKTA
jgi:cyclopropane fatty-acyl-phospholipid synthase-like methyltransferase